MKIILGTTSPQKIESFNKVLGHINLIADVETIEVNSGISEQPSTSKETKLGSINRAKNALNQSFDADLALGIEFGYQLNKDNLAEIFCWTTVVDKKGKQISSRSHKLLLPEFYQQAIRDGVYLSDCAQNHLCQATDNLSQYIANVVCYRKPFIEVSIESALLNYFVE